MNTRLLPRIFLAALLVTVISLGAPQAFAGEKEDTDSSEAADKADKAAEAADSAWDEYEKQKADAKDDGKTDKEAEEAAAEAKKAAEQAEVDAKKDADASKAADEKAKKADDKEIENRADKKDKDDVRKNRHIKRAERRQARKHLRGLKAELRKRKRIGGEEDSSKTKDLEKKIKDLEKSLGIQPPPKQPGSERSLLGQVIASGKASASLAGTGETIGHVADLKIQNLTDQPLTCAIPPMILESVSGKNQDYACPRGQSVALNPQQTKTVPMNGVCLNRNKPPVGKGVSGDLVMNEANPAVPQNPNAHLPATDANKLLRSCAAKYTVADQLQKSGVLKDLPYHDPQKQKNIVVQWSTWTDPVICQMTGSPPATKEDLRKVVYKQVEEQGPMTPEKKKKVDKGIDTIFEKVELTSAKAKDLEKSGPFFEGTVPAGLDCPDLCDPTKDSEKNRVVEVDFEFVKFHEGQVQPIYNVRTRICCDLCLKETCWVYWSRWNWNHHCTDWKTKFQVMMTDKDNWQNLDFATKSYKSKADVEADAREMAKTDQCVKLK